MKINKGLILALVIIALQIFLASQVLSSFLKYLAVEITATQNVLLNSGLMVLASSASLLYFRFRIIDILPWPSRLTLSATMVMLIVNIVSISLLIMILLKNKGIYPFV